MSRLMRQTMCGAALAAVACAAATAQTKPPEQNAPQHFDAQATDGARSGETLSERLARSNGIIKPPVGIDPEIHETPPPTGDRMPVIPPPVAPDGRPAQPK